ncbi:hypothetical protein NBH00_11115 [Paraconexibacter antarcticus]|uniref:Transposase InsH N-terminal domain-containing protein n=1 Tax=Paraconexibacter antarcticus TaxID=2949664 RepID=A0ABY5DZT3_9ACTN|nr:hypothetical protein [Paraconexibacter antarcticus]UTI66736.1 hypothetical protein NBH00_11115 [Paraconexibacter antarcticus]
MMVALVLYAFAIGERSSPGVERRCVEDIAFCVIPANQPTIARSACATRMPRRIALWGRPVCVARCGSTQ